MLRKYPYISAIVISILLAIVVWMCVPKYYAARIKISDEYKEVDLALGLNKFQAHLRDKLGSANKGINDIEVYCKLLLTDNFAHRLSRKPLADKGMTYGEWLMVGRQWYETTDTIDVVKGNILYNIHTKQQTLDIQFTDRDPVVAARMLDYTIDELQDIVSESRHSMAMSLLRNVERERKVASGRYQAAQREYADFCDSHCESRIAEEKQEAKRLEDNVQEAYKEYQKYAEQCVRQQALVQRTHCSFAIVKPNSVPVKDESHPIAYVIVFILFAVSTVKAYRLYRKRREEHVCPDFGGLFSPWTISLGVWGGMGLLFFFLGENLDPLTDLFYTSISLWLPIIVITSFVTYNLLEHKTKPLPTNGIEINTKVFYTLFIIAVLLCPMYIYKVWQIASMFDTKKMMNNIRILAVHGDGMGLLNYTTVIAQSLFLVALWRYPRLPGWQLAIIMLCCMINSLAIMEKGGFFLLVLCGIYVLYERGVIKIRSIVLVLAVLILVFFGFNLMREGEDSDYSQNETFIDFIAMYVMSPPVAYCTVMRETTSQFGTNTFEVFYNFMERFGMGHYIVNDKLQEFVYVPVSTNVYTVMQPFYRDFGYVGVAFFAWVYGVVNGVLYRYSRNGNAFCVCMYTYMVELLVLQFFQDNFTLSISFNVQLTMLLVIYTQWYFKFSIFKSKG